MADWVKGVEAGEFFLPTLPNFIKLPNRERAQGYVQIDIADLSANQLRELSQRWGTALIRHSAHRLAQRGKEAKPNG